MMTLGTAIMKYGAVAKKFVRVEFGIEYFDYIKYMTHKRLENEIVTLIYGFIVLEVEQYGVKEVVKRYKLYSGFYSRADKMKPKTAIKIYNIAKEKYRNDIENFMQLYGLWYNDIDKYERLLYDKSDTANK